MIITRLEQPEKRERANRAISERNAKIKVYIDECYAFTLLTGELKEYGLEEGSEISEAVYDVLLHDIVAGHARQKVLSQLKFMDRTEWELRNRLSEEGYPEEIIQKTLEYVFHYGYLNDERYAANYIRQRKETKSKRILWSELSGKGINKELLENIFATEYMEQEEDPETTAIRKAIAKKGKSPDEMTREEKQKLIAGLYRKGFELDKIKKLVE